ncbi:unnamed protein product [Gadus morhua 'NCC']
METRQCIIMAAFLSGLIAGDSISPDKQKYPSSPPQFLIKDYMELSGFTLKKESDKQMFHLEISSAAVTDSALYYCAQQPTVTGNTDSLPSLEMETWLWIIIAALLSECKGEDSVNQISEVIATEGHTSVMEKTESIRPENMSLPLKDSQFMLRRSTFGGDNAPEFRKDRFDAEIQIKSVPLSIQNLQLSDSALYYCALRPTVTGNTDSLYKNLLNTKQLSLYP